MKKLHMNLPSAPYDITVGAGLLSSAGELFNLKRRVLIITDSGVPREYSEKIKNLCHEAKIVTLPEGEASKSPENFIKLCSSMLDFNMSRKDAVVAVGGGMVGDISGFAASAYMRGVDFYNVPTTSLSQLDSSIGGKCAVNLGVTKNIVGAFHQPRAVLIDTNTLKTLDKRQLSSGLAEAVKMAVTSNADLFRIFEEEDINETSIEKIITEALKIKKCVVEEDEKEAGLRKILNFGHTFGHGIEAANPGRFYHGECVALGMIPMISNEDRARLVCVLKKLGLPTEFDFDIDEALSFISHDKKCEAGMLDAVFSDKIGSYRIKKISTEDFKEYIKNNISYLQ